jgi:hypothetical protein
MTQKLSAILMLTFSAIAATVIFIFPPSLYPFYPPCFFKKWTGFDCPGCGGTRAIHELLQGHFISAAHYNLAVFIFIPVILVGLLRFISNRFSGPWQYLNRPALILGILLTFWIARNIPTASLAWLNSGK